MFTPCNGSKFSIFMQCVYSFAPVLKDPLTRFFYVEQIQPWNHCCFDVFVYYIDPKFLCRLRAYFQILSCYRPSYICPSHNCDVPMVNHVRYFAHGTGSLYIHMRNLESPIPGYDRTILTWSWCKQCKQVIDEF